MAAEKLITLFGLAGVTEANYGSGDAPADTDAILLMEPVEAALEYIHAGERGLQPGTGGPIRRSAPGGRFIEFEYGVHARGPGVAYSPTDTPRDLHVGMLMSGHAATLDATGGSESYTYDPESSGFDSGSFAAYSRGQRWLIDAAYASLNITIDGPGQAVFSFATQGLVGIPTDAAVPATFAYLDPTILPPKAENIQISINAVTGWVARSLTFNQNRALDPRADINSAAGHAGFSPGVREPTLEMVLEARALSSLDPYTLRNAGTAMVVTFTVGSVQYNRFTFTANQAQLISVGEDSDGATALWTLEFLLPTSSPTADDEYEIVFD